MAASAVPRLIAVVVLPTPPFWLAMASTRGGLAGSVRSASDDDLRIGSARRVGSRAGRSWRRRSA